MRMSGRRIHCDVDRRAGQRKDARGKAGLLVPVWVTVTIASFLNTPDCWLAAGFLRDFRGDA